MSRRKTQQLEQQLAHIEKRLSRAEAYILRNVNIEGNTFVHLGDWEGTSGHPSWMKNWMIPNTLRHRAQKEQALQKVNDKAKEKLLSVRKRNGRCL